MRWISTGSVFLETFFQLTNNTPRCITVLDRGHNPVPGMCLLWPWNAMYHFTEIAQGLR